MKKGLRNLALVVAVGALMRELVAPRLGATWLLVASIGLLVGALLWIWFTTDVGQPPGTAGRDAD